ncbi:hypothetical protein PTKIN_Ptkin18bG0086600 [Pterospermum kingtungense]
MVMVETASTPTELLRLQLKERERGLAGFKTTAFRAFGGGKRKKKIRRLMEWWHKMMFPVRKVWFAVSARVKARKNGAGLLKLHDDVQTCGYQDVQVMWEMLRRSSETDKLTTANNPKRKQRPFWRVFVWSSNHTC